MIIGGIMFLALITVAGILLYLSWQANALHRDIMKFYNKTKNKIIMPEDLFYHYRHGFGNGNNGLWFPRGFNHLPVYNSPDGQIEIELIDRAIKIKE